MDVTIRFAAPEEAERLTQIACASKAHWGYSAAQIDCWRAAFLTVTADYIQAHSVWIALDAHGEAIAFAALERHETGAVLEHLWVLPAYIGRGIGKRLFERVASEAAEFTFTSDPHADGFYRKLGARKIGDAPSAHQGHCLSRFRFRALA